MLQKAGGGSCTINDIARALGALACRRLPASIGHGQEDGQTPPGYELVLRPSTDWAQ